MGRYAIDHSAVSGLNREPSIDAAIRQVADAILQDSQAAVPVDTGKLKASGFRDGIGSEYRVGYDADYAAYVEHGTSDTRPQPYLTPAALKNRGRL